MPLFVLVANFGIAAAFNICYISNIDTFPTLFSASAMGICNFFARVVSIASPEIAEIQPITIPIFIFAAFAMGGCVLS